jgi:predicted nucleic acid-binding protein
LEVISLLVDTNAYAAFKAGNPDAISVIRQAARIAMNPVVLGELLAGFGLGSRGDANRQELARFLESPRVVVYPLDEDTAGHYADIYARLRKAATPIPTNDMWIAASALQYNLSLYTFDQHFHAVVGLRSGSSWSELA